MYGGHIINDFDRTLASTYMEFFMREELLDEMGLHPYPDTATAANTVKIAKAEDIIASIKEAIYKLDVDYRVGACFMISSEVQKILAIHTDKDNKVIFDGFKLFYSMKSNQIRVSLGG